MGRGRKKARAMEREHHRCPTAHGPGLGLCRPGKAEGNAEEMILVEDDGTQKSSVGGESVSSVRIDVRGAASSGAAGDELASTSAEAESRANNRTFIALVAG